MTPNQPLLRGMIPKSTSLSDWLVSPLDRLTMRCLFVSVATNSTYPYPSRMTCVLAAPASQAVAVPVLVRELPLTETPTALVQVTGSSAAKGLARGAARQAATHTNVVRSGTRVPNRRSIGSVPAVGTALGCGTRNASDSYPP